MKTLLVALWLLGWGQTPFVSVGGGSAPSVPSRACPDVRGTGRNGALQILGQAGLQMRETTVESDRTPGIVLAQRPGPGEPVGDTVLVYLAAPRVSASLAEPAATSRPASRRWLWFGLVQAGLLLGLWRLLYRGN